MSITSNSCITDNTILSSNYGNTTNTATTTTAYPNWNYTTTGTTIYSTVDDYLNRIIELEKYVEKEKKEKWIIILNSGHTILAM